MDNNLNFMSYMEMAGFHDEWVQCLLFVIYFNLSRKNQEQQAQLHRLQIVDPQLLPSETSS